MKTLRTSAFPDTHFSHKIEEFMAHWSLCWERGGDFLGAGSASTFVGGRPTEMDEDYVNDKASWAEIGKRTVELSWVMLCCACGSTSHVACCLAWSSLTRLLGGLFSDKSRSRSEMLQK